MIGRKNEKRNGNKTETNIKGNWEKRRGVKKAKKEKIYMRVTERNKRKVKIRT